MCQDTILDTTNLGQVLKDVVFCQAPQCAHLTQENQKWVIQGLLDSEGHGDPRLTCTPHLHCFACTSSPALPHLHTSPALPRLHFLTCMASPAEYSSRLSCTTPGGAFPWVPWGGLWINNESDSGFCVKIRFHSILILVLFRDTNTSGLSPLQASL